MSNHNCQEFHTKIELLRRDVEDFHKDHEAQQQTNIDIFQAIAATQQKIAETQSMLTERIISLEKDSEYAAKSLDQLKKDNSLQTKILSGIGAAVFAAAVKMFFGGLT
jgi:uncharacterized membrane protein YjjP (DUF1212 family)